MDKFFSGIIEAFLILIPRHDQTLVQWITKLLTVSIISFSIIALIFLNIRDSPIGSRLGINSPPVVSELTNKEYRDISAILYTYLLRLKEENSAVRSSFFVAIFDKNGNINFADENYDRIGVFTWYVPQGQYLSFQTFEEVLTSEKREYLNVLGVDKLCVRDELNPLSQERYKQAMSGFISNRIVICPVPDQTNRLPFGAVVAFWVNDPKDQDQDRQIEESVKVAADNIGQYLKSRKDLELNR